MNREPRPGAVATVTRPPCFSAVALTNASPSPLPSISGWRSTPNRWNGSNRRGNASAGMPSPSSATVQATPAVGAREAEAHAVPAGLYLIAFESRLASARASSWRSPRTHGSGEIEPALDANLLRPRLWPRLVRGVARERPEIHRLKLGRVLRLGARELHEIVGERERLARIALDLREGFGLTGGGSLAWRASATSIRIDTCGERMSCERKRSSCSRWRSASLSGVMSASRTMSPMRRPS